MINSTIPIAHRYFRIADRGQHIAQVIAQLVHAVIRQVGLHGPGVMIGKHECGDNSPSIEVIVKLASAFDVSVDFLLGEGLNTAYDKEMVKRLDEFESLPADEKQRIFHYMDLVIGIIKQKKRTLNDKSR